MKRLLLSFIALATMFAAAQPIDRLLEQYNMARLDLTAGLPHDNVNHIFVDSHGFIWVSSYGGGAVRYDGYTFMTPDFGSGKVAMSNSCKGFAEDRHQRLWIAYDEGTVVIDLKTMTRVVPAYGKSDISRWLGLATVRVYCDAKGGLWQVGRDSIFRYEFDEQGGVSHISSCDYRGNTPDIVVNDIEQNGTVWLNVQSGFCRLRDNGQRLEQGEIAPVMTAFNGLFVTDMLRQGNVVWISTNEGLYAYDTYNSTLRSYRHTMEGQSLSHNYATSLALTTAGKLLVGTLKGINMFDENTESFMHWNASTPECPMPSDFVHCLLNYGGQLWIGTETAGIVKLSPKPLLLRNYVHENDRPESLSPNPVNAIYVESDGTLWAGTVEGGLNCKTVGGGFSHWTTENSSLSHNSVSVLEPDAHGHLWIGTWGGGVHVMTLKEQHWIRSAGIPAEMEMQTRYIGALAYDRYNDCLWIGSNDGVFCYDLQTGKVEDPFDGNRNIRGCVGACVDRQGHLWMGCITGVCNIDLKAGRAHDGKFRCLRLRQKLDQPQSQVIDRITSICETKDGTLWLGSDGYGLYRRVIARDGKEHFEVLTTDHGLANNSVKGIVEDAQGRIWATTNNGLSVYDPRTRTFVNYGEREGLLCQRFYWNAVAKAPDGAICLGSMKGLTEIRGENMDASYPLHLSFTRLVVDNQEITSASSSIIDSDISQARKIRLHESNKSLAISFSTLSYAGERGLYSYRMKGFEDEWTTLKPGEHSVRYTSLKPGSYVFEVQYVTNGEVDNHAISIQVEVAPYFWKSWWFMLLVLMGVVGVAYWTYRRRMDAWRRQEAEKLLLPIRKAIDDSDDPEQLQRRVQTILDNHEYLKKSFHRTVEADKREATVNKKGFMEQAMSIMEENYMNSEFGVTEFAEAIGMSKSLVSKRLNAEVGQSTGQFIRNYRLTVAKKLILENLANRNITEIAYRVGFNDPKYFTRCFTRRYGHSPSVYMEEDVLEDKSAANIEK